jgi:hypothetical protein
VAKSTEDHFREHQHLSPLGYGLIMDGNKSSMRFVGNRPDSNHYSPLSRVIGRQVIHTILLALPVAGRHNYIIRRAQTEDIPDIVRLLNTEHKDRLFGKTCTETSFQATLQKSSGLSITDYFLAFDHRGQCCGVCAAWDMGGMKQTRVLQYGRAFLPARAAWKAISILFNRPPLPEPGQHFREVTLTDCAVQDRNPAIMNALLRRVYREYRKLGYHFMIWGSCMDDPLLLAAKDFMSQKIVSNIVLFSTQAQLLEEGRVKNHLPYIDISAI